MHVFQSRWDGGEGFGLESDPLPDAQLVLLFASPSAIHQAPLHEVVAAFPNAIITGCSTAGEIEGVEICDESVTLTAIHFEHTQVRGASATVDGIDRGYQAARSIADRLIADDLRHVLVFSDGLNVNGSELTEGLRSVLPASVAVTGGLAADGDRFEQTWVFCRGQPKQSLVCAVGFYGQRLRVGFGSLGGWDSFGPERKVTKCDGNVLHELDGQSALSLYKKYLGEYAAGLPATGLLFPLSLRDPSGDDRRRVVRTLLSVDDTTGAMTFAGDLPEGHLAQLMRANFERLIEGAYGAAVRASATVAHPELALLISCVGRRLVLKQRTEEELEAVQEMVGARASLTGFYSYGEICPVAADAGCDLHNQTMTITTFGED